MINVTIKKLKSIYYKFINANGSTSFTIRDLRNMLWPTYESEEILNPQSVFQKYNDALSSLNENEELSVLQKLYEISNHLYDEEEKRRLDIAQKASISLSAIGISSAIVVGLASLLSDNKLHIEGILDVLIMLGYIGTLVYLLRAVILALRIFGKNVRYCIGPDDLPPSSRNENQYLLELSKKFIQYTIENYKINNVQMSIVWVSQECFRNAIFLLIANGFLIGLKVF